MKNEMYNRELLTDSGSAMTQEEQTKKPEEN